MSLFFVVPTHAIVCTCYNLSNQSLIDGQLIPVSALASVNSLYSCNVTSLQCGCLNICIVVPNAYIYIRSISWSKITWSNDVCICDFERSCQIVLPRDCTVYIVTFSICGASFLTSTIFTNPIGEILSSLLFWFSLFLSQVSLVIFLYA